MVVVQVIVLNVVLHGYKSTGAGKTQKKEKVKQKELEICDSNISFDSDDSIDYPDFVALSTDDDGDNREVKSVASDSNKALIPHPPWLTTLDRSRKSTYGQL